MTVSPIARRDDTAALAIRPGQEMWSEKQKAALSAMGIKDATNADLAVFMHYCQKTQLDPFSRQIYMIARREKQGDQWVTKQTIQVGIDGFRVIRDRVAERTGCAVEIEDTTWYDAGGQEHAVWLWDDAPAACRVVLVKHQAGRTLRYPGVLRTASYIQRNGKGEPVSQWKTQPEHMIEKCCEAFATRRAFPNDFSGIYIPEETGGRADDGVMQVSRAGADAIARRVTAAEIIREPQAEPAEPQPERRRAAADVPATSKALEKLNGLLASLPLGPEETRRGDERAILSWLAGGDWTATTAQVRLVTSQVESFIESAGGDLGDAATAIWVRYHDQNPQVPGE